MAIINSLEEAGLRLPLSWGRHPVKGLRTKHRVEMVGNQKQVSIQVALGLAPWEACEELYYSNHLIDPARFVFHPGHPNDAPDWIFPEDDPHPGYSYLSVQLEPGMADEDNPDKLEGIYRTQRVALYDAAGVQVRADGSPIPAGDNPYDHLFYSAQPALCVADFLRRTTGRRQPVVANSGADTFTASGHGLANGWAVRFVTGGTLPAPLQRDTDYFVVNAAADTFQVSPGFNGAPVSLADAGSGALFVRDLASRIVWPDWHAWHDFNSFGLAWDDGTTTRTIPRFETHLFFRPPFRVADALDRFMEVTCADWQRAGGKLRFMPPTPRAPVFHCDMTKIGKGTFKTRAQDRRRKPTTVRVNFRDLESQFLSPAGTEGAAEPVVIRRQALVDAAGGVETEHVIDMGGCHRSQAERTGHFWARDLCDLDQYTDYDAPPSAYRVLPGDVVTTTHALPEWDGVEAKVLRKEEDDLGRAGYPLNLKLYSGAQYSDTDHGPLVRPLPPPRLNPYAAPPVVSNVILGYGTRTLPSGQKAVVITGDAVFQPYVGRQTGRVWWKRSSEGPESWAPYPLPALLPEPATLHAPFELLVLDPDSYDVKVVTHSEAGVTLDFEGHPTFSITIPVKAALLKLAEPPLVRTSDFGLGFLAGWVADEATPGLALGAHLYRDRQLGQGPELVATFTEEASGGVTAAALAPFAEGQGYDAGAVLRVNFQHGVPVTVTETQALEGRNRVVVSSANGAEVLHYTTAAPVSGTTYDLAGLWRGQAGTEWAAPLGHPAGATVLVVADAVQFVPLTDDDVGTELLLKLVPFGSGLGETAAVPFTPVGNSAKPLAIRRVEADPQTLRAPRTAAGTASLSYWPATNFNRIGDEYALDLLSDDRGEVRHTIHHREGDDIPGILIGVRGVKYPGGLNENSLSRTFASTHVQARTLQLIQFADNHASATLRITGGSLSHVHFGLVRSDAFHGLIDRDLVNYRFSLSVATGTLKAYAGAAELYSEDASAYAAAGRRVKLKLVGTKVYYYVEGPEHGDSPVAESEAAPPFPLTAFAEIVSLDLSLGESVTVSDVRLTTNPFPTTVVSYAEQIAHLGAVKDPMQITVRQFSGSRRVGYGFPYHGAI